MPNRHLMFNVFISSTWIDLKSERNAVEAALQRMREIKYIGMEYFGSRDESSREGSLNEVEQCQLCISIIGSRYGSGITELEYQKTRELNLPCFVYFKDEATVHTDFIEQDSQKSAQLKVFKAKLRQGHLFSEFTSPDDLAARVTADLHRWLTDNYLLAAVEKAAHGEYSQRQLEDLISGVRDLTSLREELQKRAQIMGPVYAQGERSVAVDGANAGIINTGDIIFKIFANAPTPLSQYIRVREFQSLLEERTRGFVGREFIFNAIDELLKDHKKFPSGYIVIQGEPGVGKTALLGQLVKLRGYIHHFNSASQNIRSVPDFLSNVCAQLITRYGLKHSVLPPNATKDSGFLSQLLSEASSQDSSSPIVIVIDAIDEAEDIYLSPDANRLFLPPNLPDGVFFLITTREKYEYRLEVYRREDLHIHDTDPRNLEDVRQYIYNFITEHHVTMSERIAQWNSGSDEFIDVMTGKSQGNFMYLVHILRDIDKGLLTYKNVDTIYDLPTGLREYYQRHWRVMKAQEPDRFKDYYEPVVCILATAREPVSIAQVVEWANSRWPHLNPGIIQDVIRVWREFLNVDRTEGGPPLYRLYHTSFQDFLKEEVGLRFYHDLIALTALRKIPGMLST